MIAGDVLLAGGLFVAAYALIATERLHKTVVALGGGVFMVVLGVISQDEAFAAIDLNVIFLLVGMMVIADVMRGTGVFQWIAIRSVRLSAGDPWRLLVILSVITAVASAILDNVTTVVLIGPITLFIASAMRVSPVPYLIAEILASNIGGTATLIGDPPNILIASAADIDFGAFLANMGPPAVATLAVFLVLARVLFGADLAAHRDQATAVDIDESTVISDPRTMRISVLVMGGTILGFLAAGPLGLEPATVALLGATILFALTGREPADVLKEVEWSTLLFFAGLFMLVEGVIHVGIIDGLAESLFHLTAGDVAVTSLALLWVSGLASGIIDNIPYTATVIPIVQDLGGRGMPTGPLWWSLALGADLGGNATIIGASANVVIASLAERAGYRISFWHFFRYGAVVTIVSLGISSLYLWLRYLG